MYILFTPKNRIQDISQEFYDSILVKSVVFTEIQDDFFKNYIKEIQLADHVLSKGIHSAEYSVLKSRFDPRMQDFTFNTIEDYIQAIG